MCVFISFGVVIITTEEINAHALLSYSTNNFNLN